MPTTPPEALVRALDLEGGSPTRSPRAGDRHSSSRSQSSVDREDPSAILEMVACGESARRRASDRAEKALAGLDGAEAASGDLARGLRVGESPSSSRARTSASGGVVGMFTP